MKLQSKWIAAVLVLFVGSLGAAYGQTGGSKDTKKLKEKVDSARKSIEDAENGIKSTMELYNSLIEQKAKKTDATYKKLSKGVEDSDKFAKNARKAVDAMNKDLEKFYKAWEKEVAGYTTGAMKDQSQKSLDKVKSKFQRFDTSVQEASDLYDPFISSLRDQVLYLGRDLSPEAIESLGDQAKDLNDNASKLYEKIEEILNDTKAGADEAVEAAAEMDQAGDDSADG